MNKAVRTVCTIAVALGVGYLFWPWEWYQTYPIPGGDNVKVNRYTGYGCAYAPEDVKAQSPLACRDDISAHYPRRLNLSPSTGLAAVDGWEKIDRQRAKIAEYQAIYNQAKVDIESAKK